MLNFSICKKSKQDGCKSKIHCFWFPCTDCQELTVENDKISIPSLCALLELLHTNSSYVLYMRSLQELQREYPVLHEVEFLHFSFYWGILTFLDLNPLPYLNSSSVADPDAGFGAFLTPGSGIQEG
jgi:hypothetical protein